MHELGLKWHKTASQLAKTVSWTMGLLQLSNHMVQNRHTGEQMTHWDTLNKATKFEFSLFNISQCVICSTVWRFLNHVTARLQRAHFCSSLTLSCWGQGSLFISQLASRLARLMNTFKLDVARNSSPHPKEQNLFLI